jgi:hypothetical protein
MTITKIKRRYTQIKKRGGGMYWLWLRVDNQSFRLAAIGTKSEIEWWRDMLAIALKKMIEGGKA